MNHHELLDIATVHLSSVLARDATFFARSVDAPKLRDVASAADTAIDDVTSAGRTDVAVETPVGEFTASYMQWQWLTPDYPTIVFHHGSNEQPFDFGRLTSNSYRRLFVGQDVPANLVVVRAPFHVGSNRDYLRAMGDLENFVGMLAAATGLTEALVSRVEALGSAPVVSGISLGGWVTNLHRACFGSAARYVPLFAGAALGEMFVSSSYRHLTAETALARPDHLRAVLDFEDRFRDIADDDCRPLLGRYDRIIELDAQRSGYGALPMTVLEKGHITGSLASDALRDHVVGALPSDDLPRSSSAS